MSREQVVAAAAAHLDSGDFAVDLARRVAMRTESQDPQSAEILRAYLSQEWQPTLQAAGFDVAVHPNPQPPFGPLLVACRIEDPALPTVLIYGHGDVIRGQDRSWTCGAGPWVLQQDGQRLYGRGTADNKGQHSINHAALMQVLSARGGRLGFNVKWLLETGEETGSPGLSEFCAAHREALRSDVLIASDGPRYRSDRATVFLGSRGVANFELTLRVREGAHHSGNWGGLLRNPGVILANAIASLVDSRGAIRVPALRPPPIPENVSRALEGLRFGTDPGDPAVDEHWGEPGLSPAQRVIAWNTLEVLAYRTGNPDHPVNAIPPEAKAHMHMRYVVGTDIARLREHVLAHLREHGFGDVQVSQPDVMAATRLDPDNEWVRFAMRSIERTTGQAPVLLPNLGGSLPNDVFADVLGLPTVWIPHSYAGCQQHAPNEHLLLPTVREGLQIMAGLFWDLGEHAQQLRRPLAA